MFVWGCFDLWYENVEYVRSGLRVTVDGGRSGVIQGDVVGIVTLHNGKPAMDAPAYRPSSGQ